MTGTSTLRTVLGWPTPWPSTTWPTEPTRSWRCCVGSIAPATTPVLSVSPSTRLSLPKLRSLTRKTGGYMVGSKRLLLLLLSGIGVICMCAAANYKLSNWQVWTRGGGGGGGGEESGWLFCDFSGGWGGGKRRVVVVNYCPNGNFSVGSSGHLHCGKPHVLE